MTKGHISKVRATNCQDSCWLLVAVTVQLPLWSSSKVSDITASKQGFSSNKGTANVPSRLVYLSKLDQMFEVSISSTSLTFRKDTLCVFCLGIDNISGLAVEKKFSLHVFPSKHTLRSKQWWAVFVQWKGPVATCLCETLVSPLIYTWDTTLQK